MLPLRTPESIAVSGRATKSYQAELDFVKESKCVALTRVAVESAPAGKFRGFRMRKARRLTIPLVKASTLHRVVQST